MGLFDKLLGRGEPSAEPAPTRRTEEEIVREAARSALAYPELYNLARFWLATERAATNAVHNEVAQKDATRDAVKAKIVAHITSILAAGNAQSEMAALISETLRDSPLKATASVEGAFPEAVGTFVNALMTGVALRSTEESEARLESSRSTAQWASQRLEQCFEAWEGTLDGEQKQAVSVMLGLIASSLPEERGAAMGLVSAIDQACFMEALRYLKDEGKEATVPSIVQCAKNRKSHVVFQT